MYKKYNLDKLDFYNLLKSELSHLNGVVYEIEARLGRIHCRDTDSRLKLNSLVPIVFNELDRECYFSPGVDSWDFKDLQKGLEQEESFKDVFVYCKNGARIKMLEGKKIYCENKKKIYRVDIYLPFYKYDVRVSVMGEVKELAPKNMAEIDFERHRNRIVYGDRWFKYDFTIVNKVAYSRRSVKNKDVKNSGTTIQNVESEKSIIMKSEARKVETTYEVEIEVFDSNFRIDDLLDAFCRINKQI